MLLVPVPRCLIILIIAAFILGIVPFILVERFVEGGVDSLMGKILFVLEMAVEVILIVFLVDRMARNKQNRKSEGVNWRSLIDSAVLFSDR